MVSEFGSDEAGFDLDAQPEYVYVVDVTQPQRYMSVHTTEPGARQRITEIASEWGVSIDQVESEVIEKVIETP